MINPLADHLQAQRASGSCAIGGRSIATKCGINGVMLTAESQGKITFIVAAPWTRTNESAGPEETTRALSRILSGTMSHAVEIDAEDLRNNISNCLDQMKQVFTNLQEPAIDGWSVRSISIGLTISAGGSVGVATAGVEASIEIGFSPAT